MHPPAGRHVWAMGPDCPQDGAMSTDSTNPNRRQRTRVEVPRDLLDEIDQLLEQAPVRPSRTALVRRALRHGLRVVRAEIQHPNGSGLSGIRC